MKKIEEKEIDQKMEHLESLRDDNTRYHYAMREINKPKNKIPILVKDQEGNVPGCTQCKIKIIEGHFKRTLPPPEMENECISFPPSPMKKPFTAAEIKSIAKRF